MRNIENTISPLIDDFEEKEKDKEIKLKLLDEDSNSDEKNKIADVEAKNYCENKEDNYKNINKYKMPKLTFFDFFYNNIYCIKCKKFKNQELLDRCNKIIAEYISIDSVLSYILKLENLLKDYKWNNPKLNYLQNNELINNLINYLNLIS